MKRRILARRLGVVALVLQVIVGCGVTAVIPPAADTETGDAATTEPSGPEIIVRSDEDTDDASDDVTGSLDAGREDAAKPDAGRADAGAVTICTSPRIACAGACVQPTTTTHCGGCAPCKPAPPNATAQCLTGSCKYYCKLGFHPEGGACVRDTLPPLPPPVCLPQGSDCTLSSQCCNHDCFFNICICRGVGHACTIDSDCCKGLYCGVNSKTCRGVESP